MHMGERGVYEPPARLYGDRTRSKSHPKDRINLASPALIVQRDINNITDAPQCVASEVYQTGGI